MRPTAAPASPHDLLVPPRDLAAAARHGAREASTVAPFPLSRSSLTRRWSRSLDPSSARASRTGQLLRQSSIYMVSRARALGGCAGGAPAAPHWIPACGSNRRAIEHHPSPNSCSPRRSINRSHPGRLIHVGRCYDLRGGRTGCEDDMQSLLVSERL